ncbi:MAG: hypothetical protein H0V89_12480 [Deltaproteobacteria bacterium]|nr:hypothetical protein [Deltaproteobacteria bacterium]
MTEILPRLHALAVTRFGPGAAALGADDDLFQTLGVDSLAALDLLTDLEGAFGVEIPDWEIQGVSTLRGLADVLARRL